MSNNQPAEGVRKMLDSVRTTWPNAPHQDDPRWPEQEAYQDGYDAALVRMELALQGHEIVKEGLVKAYEDLLDLVYQEPDHPNHTCGPESLCDQFCAESASWKEQEKLARHKIASLSEAPHAPT